MTDKIKEKLMLLYPDSDIDKIYSRIIELITDFKGNKKRIKDFSEEDVILITYGDQFRGNEQKPLKNLKMFCDEYLKGAVNTIHILPFYPYSSDDGFSVIDYEKVDDNLGSWEDIESFSQEYKLMFDFVCNHISSKSMWFQEYLKGNPIYKDYFIEVDKETDLSQVVRPRALPLLTEFDTVYGKKYIWTTFSDDQIDLNYKNPDVLINMIKILLFYIERGADLIRLDAIGYLWKEIGTRCIHLEQTHAVVQLFRDILDKVAPEVKIITETNVPHEENISYFGDGHNEAQLVYQFPLPPLILYTFINENSKVFTNWAKTIKPVSDETTYFNFLASHDGIGLNPLRGIVDEDEINKLVFTTIKRGGLVSYKNNSDGGQSPYELNISYFNALSDASEDVDIKIKKFLNAYSIILAMQGIPGIYVHSILGSKNYCEGVIQTGQNRSINREKFYLEKIVEDLNNDYIRNRIYNGFIKLLNIRKKSKAFSPKSEQKILDISSDVIAIIRSLDKQKVFSINNITSKEVKLILDIEEIGATKKEFESLSDKVDIITNDKYIMLNLKPYEFVWLAYE
ncbi:Sucrose phosphorylase [Caloramator mitchellensis]|uniref:Sucrose 6(F)-phosphate phosphorylase n=1 Tax=Caloramator mitchellensis TaxID=908809 RepID=A0A0R3K3J2_CALMK|nr:sugar phosphorylase [Caloramator mitchellensis]KRQ87621.1 Sucrose phosphorylase [Caloramator mitchellensis]